MVIPRVGIEDLCRLDITNRTIYQRQIGYFNSDVDAAIAYNNKAVEVFGEFAILNKIDE